MFLLIKPLLFPKVTTEAQLGLIGGTMGLLTGFSILSGVEIIYYLLRFQLFKIFKIKVARSLTQASARSKALTPLVNWGQLWNILDTILGQLGDNFGTSI